MEAYLPGEKTMKKLSASIVVLAICLFAGSSAFAQASEPVMPDYSNWEKDSRNFTGTLNGKTVILPVGLYMHTDLVNLKRHFLAIVFNENNESWFAFLTEETGEKHPDGTITTKSRNYYLFENRNSNWEFVRDFSNSTDVDKDGQDFIADRYGLISD